MLPVLRSNKLCLKNALANCTDGEQSIRLRPSQETESWEGQGGALRGYIQAKDPDSGYLILSSRPLLGHCKT